MAGADCECSNNASCERKIPDCPAPAANPAPCGENVFPFVAFWHTHKRSHKNKENGEFCCVQRASRDNTHGWWGVWGCACTMRIFSQKYCLYIYSICNFTATVW